LTIRNSKLTRSPPSPQAGTPPATAPDTLRVWSEKTTVCRIFSCKRARESAGLGAGSLKTG
jgi:hypothetical protein